MKKKTIFPLFLLPAALLFSCEEPPVYDDDNASKTDVVWSADWKYITIYLDGQTSPPPLAENVTRAMTIDTTRTGFDYFEVIFYYNDGTEHIARASWEIGMPAYVYGVFKNVNYSRTGTASLDSGQGAALMIAGRKSDKTVLAFGKVYSVDEVTGALIKSDTVCVTFELFTLTASVNIDPALSSFITNTKNTAAVEPTAANTRIINALIGGRSFPMYILPPDKTVKAQYKFEIREITKEERAVPWSDFSSGVRLAEKGIVETREARYPAGNGKYWYPLYPRDQVTTVTMTNNQTAGNAAQNPVAFNINTQDTLDPLFYENGVFTLAFKIPVYAISDVVYVFDEKDNEPETWHIRAAYQSYYYNIDNGKDSTGGAVLMGVVDVTEFDVNRTSG